MFNFLINIQCMHAICNVAYYITELWIENKPIILLTYIMYSLFRDIECVEYHVDTLIDFLMLCIQHNHTPSKNGKIPSHAKISSDILSCLFLINVSIYFKFVIIYLFNNYIIICTKGYLYHELLIRHLNHFHNIFLVYSV